MDDVEQSTPTRQRRGNGGSESGRTSAADERQQEQQQHGHGSWMEEKIVFTVERSDM
jgi:hypothetical protein